MSRITIRSRKEPLRKDVKRMLIGVISDTHGLVRPQAVEALRGAEMIVHAGDVGGEHVLAALQVLAPVAAVRGNCDRGEWAELLPLRMTVEAAGMKIFLLHDRKELREVPEGVRVVISGHSHRPAVEERDGILYLNPGSAGRRRFDLRVTVALLEVEGEQVAARIVELAMPAPG